MDSAQAYVPASSPQNDPLGGDSGYVAQAVAAPVEDGSITVTETVRARAVYSFDQPKLCCITNAYDTRITVDVAVGDITFEVNRGNCKATCCRSGSSTTTSLRDVVHVQDDFAQVCSWATRIVFGILFLLVFAGAGIALLAKIYDLSPLASVADLNLFVGIACLVVCFAIFVATVYACVRCSAAKM